MILWERVEELRSEVGHDGFDEIVALFLEEADEVVTRLSKEFNPQSIEADLHFLKGAALNLGFSDFADFCQEGERAASNGPVTFDPRAMRTLYDSSRAAFVRGLASANAA